MRRSSSELALFYIRILGIVITFFLDAVTTLQLEKVFTISDLLSDPKVYLPVTLLMVVLMLWWSLDSEFKLRQAWDEEPNILAINDHRVETILSSVDSAVKYGVHSSLSYSIINGTAKFHLLYIDFINKPNVPKDNSAKDVSAFIEYYDLSGKKVKGNYGRWIGMPEGEEETTHRYTEIPSDGQTRKRLGIAVVLTGDKFFVLNGDAVSDKFEFYSYLTSLESGEYIIKTTVSCSNISKPLIMYFTLKSKDMIASLNIKEDGEKWLEEKNKQ